MHVTDICVHVWQIQSIYFLLSSNKILLSQKLKPMQGSKCHFPTQQPKITEKPSLAHK